MEENLFLANTFISFIELGYFVITRLMVLSTNLQYLYQWTQNVIITIEFIGVVFRKINLLTFIHVTKLITIYISMVLGKKGFMLCFEDNFVHWNKCLNKLMLSIPLLYKCSSLINLAQTCDIFLIDLVQTN